MSVDRPEGGGWAVFRHSGFACYWASLLLTGFAVQIQTVAVGWQIYDLTHDPLDLGLVGLSQFAPALLLVLVTGAVADRCSRRRVIAVSIGVQGCAAAGLLAFTLGAGAGAVVWPIFAIIVLFGTARAFYSPARQSLVANLVPFEHLQRAVAANSTANQTATICGPVAGGLLYGLATELAYAVTVALLVASALLILAVPRQPRRPATAQSSDRRALSAGFQYIWSDKPVLEAISLDLLAVLFGGAMAMLPVYARDNPRRRGERARSSPKRPGGRSACRGLRADAPADPRACRPADTGRGRPVRSGDPGVRLSTSVWISAVALLLSGAFDMVSVMIRQTFIQVRTPDELRGRVLAVNQVFVGASNELGAFRAGSMAALIGPVAAVAIGGVCTMAITCIWVRVFPDLRRGLG